MNRPLRLTECFVGVCGMFATFCQSVRSVMANHKQPQGPIYRARIYVFATHSQSVGGTFTECSPHISWADVALLTIRSEYIHRMFATCSLSVCYIFAMQKGGFCVAKVWFLACKNPLFTLQKPPFWRARSGFLQSLNQQVVALFLCFGQMQQYNKCQKQTLFIV